MVGGISRDRDFLLMLFSIAVSVTNYAFPYMTESILLFETDEWREYNLGTARTYRVIVDELN